MERHAVIVAGIGFRRNAPLRALHAALAQLPRRPDALATAAAKAEAPQIINLASELKLPLLTIDAAALAAQETPTQSARITARFGTGSLAEAAALAAAGPGARLIATRVTAPCGSATAALAEGDGR